jgi:hypothetical protein
MGGQRRPVELTSSSWKNEEASQAGFQLMREWKASKADLQLMEGGGGQ